MPSLNNLSVTPPDEATDIVDIEREIEARMIRALREVFSHDPIFHYDKDDAKNSNLVITTDFPEKENPFKTPHIVVYNISYNVDLNTSIFRNYMSDVSDSEGSIIGEGYGTVIPYSLSLLCAGYSSPSRDLANRVISYIMFIYKKIFEDLNLNISNVSKGITGASKEYPEKIFETPINLQGFVQWSGISRFINKDREHFLKHIEVEQPTILPLILSASDLTEN